MKMEYEGVAGYGGHIGFFYKPTDEWSVGFMARSPAPIEMDGEIKIAGIKYDSEVEFQFPGSFYLGCGYKPDPKLTYSLTVSYRLWGQMDEMTFRTDVIGTTKQKTYYKNTWGVAAGMEYWITDDLAFWAGFIFLQGGTEAKGLKPEDCDVNMLDPNIGFAYKISESIEVDISGVYMHGFKKEYGSKEYSFQHSLVCLGLRFEF
ncbi:MAG: outer membrane protein transport protein [Deltaproteobacteria bacterium]|nr:outer membrane protein transport protein [Deltaproteobacteria bacterium]